MDEWLGSPELVLFIQLGKQRPERERALPRGTKSVDTGVEMGNGVGGYFGRRGR